MKRTKIFYWIVTGLFGAFMLFTAIPDVLVMPDAVTFITGLGYPKYFVGFIGVAKVLGVIAIVVPRFPRLKEWAYAGLFFDLLGATYSQIAAFGLHPQIVFILPAFIFLFWSYFLYHKLKVSVA